MARHGRYTIMGKLADGGMAEIFLAVQHGAEGFEKPVVLKRILSQFSADPQFRNMLLDEGHISMSLQHSNIVQVLDLGAAGNRCFLVMELVDGWDLERILQRAYASGMVWPPALALHVSTVVCRALAYAHGKTRDGKPLGIVHRDISPNNVLISEQGEVKLADFGIAKAQRKREQTAAGVIKGKVAYMSPEQALGAVIDKRSDIFSVGSLLYRMMTDRLPFDAPTDLEQLFKVQKGIFDPPEKAKDTVTAPVSTIIMRAMRTAPAERYQSADEMLVDLERVLRNEYQSAGQTELKLWLEQLGRRDHVESNGKRRVETSGVVKDTLGTDLSAGTSFELDEVKEVSASAIGMTELSSSRPTPPPVPVENNLTPPTTVDRASAGRGVEAPLLTPSPMVTASVAPHRRRFGGFWLGAFFALAAVVGARYALQWAEQKGVAEKLGLGGREGGGPALGPPAPIETAPPPPPSPHEALAKTEPAPAPAPPPAPTLGPPAPAAEPPPAAAPTAPAETAGAPAAPVAAAPAPTPEPGVAAPPAENDDDADEEALLKKAVPNAEQAVIGADGAEPEPPPEGDKPAAPPEKAAASDGKTPKPGAKTAAKPKPPAKPTTAVLHITTSPVGAIVRTKGQVLGRTPINLHFRTGNVYELTFVKAGYQKASRLVTVKGTKDRKVALSLAKKRAPAPATTRRRPIFTPHR